MEESGYSLDSSCRISDGEIIVESLRPFLEGAIPPFDVVVPDSKCLLNEICLDPFECPSVPLSMIHDGREVFRFYKI